MGVVKSEVFDLSIGIDRKRDPGRVNDRRLDSPHLTRDRHNSTEQGVAAPVEPGASEGLGIMALQTEELWNSTSYWSEPAEQAFKAARRKARRQMRADRLRRRRTTLIPFDELVGNSGLLPESHVRTEAVPLRQIVGSVGKAQYFTRSFHPANDDIRQRWKRAFAAAHGLRGYEPIELYEVAGSYYVVDGHFRASVAKALGNDKIQAAVRRWL
jgi:hypothetical protein